MYRLISTEVRENLGILTLNSERTLNALSKEMFEELLDALHIWKADENIACIFLQGAGERAFCAGGDVRKLHDIIVGKSTQNEPPAQGCIDFFVYEYQADYLVHCYPKPIVAWLDRIVMGGGIGISNGASHRIATERSLFAMPEIAIGLYPDVGASWFLNRMPAGFGAFIGLTGARLNGADAKYLGLATHCIDSGLKGAILEELAKQKWSTDTEQNRRLVSALLEQKESASGTKLKSVAAEHANIVSDFAGVNSPLHFAEQLEVAAVASKSAWLSDCNREFQSGSPSSAHVILEQLNRAKSMSLPDVFRSELNLSVQSCLHHPDFVEGVRALLVDKDKAPKWQPAKLTEVDRSWVDSYFEPLWSEKDNPFRNLDELISSRECANKIRG